MRRLAHVADTGDCALRRDGFEHSLAACVAVLQRADDAEESIRDVVGRVFHSLWFASGALTHMHVLTHPN